MLLIGNQQVRFSAEDDVKYRLDMVRCAPLPILQCFDDFSPAVSAQYIEDICAGPGLTIQNGSFFTADYEDKYCHVRQGVRYTPGAPDEYEHSIYVMGSSVVFGSFCEDSGTVTAYLQAILNQRQPGRWRVLNLGTRAGRMELYGLQLHYLPLKKDDVVILMDLHWNSYDADLIRNMDLMCREKGAHFCFFLSHLVHDISSPSRWEAVLQNNWYQTLLAKAKGQAVELATDYSPPPRYLPSPLLSQLNAAGCQAFDLLPYLNRPHPLGEIFIDKVHVSRKGYRVLAQAIFDLFVSRLSPEPLDRAQAMARCYDYFKRSVAHLTSQQPGLSQWLAQAAPKEGDPFGSRGKTGAIVMNCNPFTLGHLYLVEKALETVDDLYVLVVEEDRSDFQFSDRLLMVEKGLAHLAKRVRVLPGGNYVISTFTFPEYFAKTELKDEKVDTTKDLAIFGVVIAPALKISCRFIGQEPLCQVTNQYNETMKRVLPPLGVEVYEIPRLESAGQAISASRVRQLYHEGHWDELKELLPSSTYRRLKELSGQGAG